MLEMKNLFPLILAMIALNLKNLQTTPGPDISVRILRKREDGTIRKPLAVRDTANILGQRRYRDAHGDQQQIPQVHKTVR